MDAPRFDQLATRTASRETTSPQAALAHVNAVAVLPTTSGAAVDELPRKLATNPAPDYPPEALADSREGRVVVRVTVASNGLVENAVVQSSSGTPSLDDSAIAAIRRWRFTPARREGIFVECEVMVPVRFRIRRS